MRAILPPLAVFSPVAVPRRRFAARLLDYLGAVDPQGARPVVFYVFSNGGWGAAGLPASLLLSCSTTTALLLNIPRGSPAAAADATPAQQQQQQRSAS